MKYFFVYVLGMKDLENRKAIKGTVLHKCLEVLGRIKMAKDQGKKTVVDEEFGKLNIGKLTLGKLNDLSFNYYSKAFNILKEEDRPDCLLWLKKAITYRDGLLDPRNQKVSNVEEFFEIEVPHDWARFEYEVDGQKVVGQLGIKGTVDLIFHEEDNTYHIQDYKSGRRYDWAKEKVKEYKDFQTDKQLLLYYYAMKTKYPERDFLVSIYYINDHKIDSTLVKGGLFTMAFDDSDYELAEQMVKEEFETIKQNSKPKALSNTCSHWKCRSLCAFSQVLPSIDPSRPACMAVREQIRDKGIEYVTNKYANVQKLTTYGSGGGRLSDEDKNIDKGT
jgi:hypothetical protein